MVEIAKRNAAAMALLAAVYFITAKSGLALAYAHPSTAGVWPPAGIALAALLLFGYDLWPAILLGAFLVNITTVGSPLVCLGIATGNTLEALAGAWLVNRYARGRYFVYRTPDIFKFALLAGLVSTAIAATFGATSLALGGFATWAGSRSIWTTWWLGDAAGDILIAPLLVLWIPRPRLRWREAQFLEAAVLLIGLVFSGLLVFDGIFDLGPRNYPLEYLCIPFLLWVAFRFGPREATAANLVLALTAIWGTMHGYGPFGRGTHNESLLLLQTFLSVVGVTTMGLATAFAERRVAEEQARLLAVSDPLTGLGNYRKLIDALEMEIKRSSRTGRPFAFLLLDLDGLKKLNDTHGHLTGSRALCRLADALRLNSRAMDTAARYGGDEFALIVPELGPDPVPDFNHDLASEFDPEVEMGPELLAKLGSVFKNEVRSQAVQQIARRISQQLANDGESPALTVSIGAALFPQDGDTIEKLVNAADQALYQNKIARHIPASVKPEPLVPQRTRTAAPAKSR